MNDPNLEEVVSIAVIQVELRRLEEKIDSNIESTKALVDAWNAAGGVVRFVKWFSTFVAALGALYLFFRHGVFPGGKGG